MCLHSPIKQASYFYNIFKSKLISAVKLSIWNADHVNGVKILSRCSCFGLELLDRLNLTSSVFNIQKGRVDFLMGKYSKIPFTRNVLIANFLKRKDIIHFILRQNDFELTAFSKPDCIFMDSYSELSDFLFKSTKEGWCFAANYFDVDHGSNLKPFFENKGLLEIDEIKFLYKSYFAKLSENFPNVPIIFLHMPSILERRKEFIQRNADILKVINSIKDQYVNLHSISLNHQFDVLDEKKNRQDPYHFDDAVYERIADLIKLKKINGLVLENQPYSESNF
jgi:hypothetical protein